MKALGYIYELESENLSNLGSMGSTTHKNYTKLFYNSEDAMLFAEEEYGKKIKWKSHNSKIITSGDLNYVMYNIHRKEILGSINTERKMKLNKITKE